ncbi:MAG: hypothetical protein P4L11_07805 [Geothrix sp.]|nr:hypothetical protein [Geothrix sp.]
MRFVPLVPSEIEPGPWRQSQAVELAWQGRAHAAWTGLPVHAVHLPETPWSAELGEAAMAVLGSGLDPDFLVLSASAPDQRLASSQFLTVLEGLLELTQGRGVKLALRPAPGGTLALVRLLREARGEAVGFCWDRSADLEAISDRLFCAVGGTEDDFSGLQALGYRWNVAVPASDPAAARAELEALGRAWPSVYFPSGLMAAPDPSVTLGRHLEDNH